MSSTKSSSSAGDVAVVAVVVAAVVFILWFVIAGSAAMDVESWDATDNGKNCFVRTHEVNNMWLTPGDSYTTRDIYCKDK
jgi:hypothetical protein